MLKKIPFLLVLLFLFFHPYQVGTVSANTVTTIQHSIRYDAPTDSYKITYSGWSSSTTWFQLYFTSTSGQVFTKEFQQLPTGYQTVNCNGTYQLQFFNANNVMVSKSNNIQTTEIKNPTCNSTPDPEPPPITNPITPYNPSPVQIPYITFFTPERLDQLWGYIKWFLFLVAPLLFIFIALKTAELFVITMRDKVTENEGRRRRRDDEW